jgi:hypothetical protein
MRPVRLTHDGDADVVLLEVQHEAEDPAVELHQLHGHHLLEAVDASNPVADRQHDAGLAQLHLLLVVRDLRFDDLAYLFSSQFHLDPLAPF